MTPEPSIRELLEAAAVAVRGLADKSADFVRGSDYESLLGPSAILWSRQAARDTDLFNAVNFNTSDGDDLTELALARYGKVRVLDSRGTGEAVLARAAAGDAETVWKGTRISIRGPSPKTYRVTADTTTLATDLTVTVPIEAVEVGPGSAANTSTGLTLDDALSDTWTVTSLSCGDGTNYERADAFRARIRKERKDARVGQATAIIQSCYKAGAANVALFRSDYAGDAFDKGLNYCYVGDQGYTGSQELVKACALALRKVRVAGDHLQVLPMARTPLDISANIYLYDSPVLFDLNRVERIHRGAIDQYLNGASGRFSYSLDGIRSAIARHTPEVQRVSLIAPASDAAIVEGTNRNFPAVLSRYVPGTVTLRYLGP